MRVAYLIGFFIVSIGVVLYLFQLDDELSDESKVLIAAVEHRAAQAGALEPYHFLYGMSAPEQVDPVTRGREDLAQYAQSGTVVKHSDKLPLTDRDEALYCSLKASGCMKQILAKRDQWDAALSTQHTLLQRYETYLGYEHFATPLSAASLNFYFPDYSYLTRGNQLKILSALKAAQEKGADVGMVMLLNDLKRLRKHLTDADTLIHKMVMVAMTANTLEAIVQVFKRFEPNQSYALAPLKDVEQNLEPALAFEFYATYQVHQELDQNPEFFEQDGDAPKASLRLVYKPNMTTNVIARRYIKVIERSKLDAQQFADRSKQSQSLSEEAPSTSDRIFNSVGSVLAQIAEPDFGRYIVRLHDLNIKFILAEHILSQREGLPANPYGSRYAVQQSEHSLCMDGPMKDDRSLRCVSWQ